MTMPGPASVNPTTVLLVDDDDQLRTFCRDCLAAKGFRVLEGDNGFIFIVFKPELLMPLDDFKREVTALIDRVKATPRQAGVDEIRIPSERAFRNRERALAEGIEIDRAVHEALERMAAVRG